MNPATAMLLLAAATLLIPERPAHSRLNPGGFTATPDGIGGAANRRETTGTEQEEPRKPLVLSCGLAAVAGGLVAAVVGPVVAVVIAPFAGWMCHRTLRGRQREDTAGPLEQAAGWDLLAAGLRAGLPVPVAVRAVAEELSGRAAAVLAEVADLLVLGADPVTAWEPALCHEATAELARAARRAARSGNGLARVAESVAEQARESVGEQAQARAQRAGVWVSAPLGLCFLPAFLCLGVLPVVVGMVERLALSR